MSQLRKVAAATALVCGMPLASAAVLTFDDLVPGPGSRSGPSPDSTYFSSDYHGFMFGSDYSTTPWFYTNDPTYTAKSGTVYVATDSSLHTPAREYEAAQPISNTTPFIFDGAFFSADFPVGYELFNGSTLVATTGPILTTSSGPEFVPSGYSGLVTSVVVFGDQGYYALDDFTYNSNIPEPQSYTLMLAGLAAVGAVALRRRRSV